MNLFIVISSLSTILLVSNHILERIKIALRYLLFVTLIPHQSESEAVYTDAYNASRRATRAAMNLQSCGSCATCKAIDKLHANETVRACLAGSPYKIIDAHTTITVDQSLKENDEFM